jgi:hypothetical protein
MRLPFDQNLSFRLVDHLSADFPDSVHVRTVGLDSAEDSQVRAFANTNGLTIVSKDATSSGVHSSMVIRRRLSGSASVTAPPPRLLRCSAQEKQTLLPLSPIRPPRSWFSDNCPRTWRGCAIGQTENGSEQVISPVCLAKSRRSTSDWDTWYLGADKGQSLISRILLWTCEAGT